MTVVRKLELTMTVKQEWEQTLEAAQVEEEKNECSEEWLNDFSQRAEITVALELAAKEAKG
jgi:hypothetical protein